ncbi:LA_2272 family surface repeat-containing protein [Cetobacterium sp.]|uniref:LA_2272 family surface repeat-containing protein n=1 Tax=Cetobacterium sp. TaxID=2071632 RepID=UPI003F2BD81A
MRKILLGTTLILGTVAYGETAPIEKTIVDVIGVNEIKEKSAQLSILPGISLGASKDDSISKFSFNLLGATNKNVTGLDLSLVGIRTVEGNFKGQHLSLIPIEKFTVKGDLNGGSFSLWNDIEGTVSGSVFGLVNTVNDANGGVAGLVNLVKGNATSTSGLVSIVDGNVNQQFGFINRADSVSGVQIGFVNSTRNLDGVQIGLVNHATNGVLPVLPLVNFRKTI